MSATQAQKPNITVLGRVTDDGKPVVDLVLPLDGGQHQVVTLSLMDAQGVVNGLQATLLSMVALAAGHDTGLGVGMPPHLAGQFADKVSEQFSRIHHMLTGHADRPPIEQDQPQSLIAKTPGSDTVQ
jgi:hypothetical protein